MSLSDAASTTAKKYNPFLAVAKYFIYKGKPIRIVRREKRRRPYTVFLWFWKTVKADGSLVNYTQSKYSDSNDEHHFKLITKKKAIEIAKKLEGDEELVALRKENKGLKLALKKEKKK